MTPSGRRVGIGLLGAALVLGAASMGLGDRSDSPSASPSPTASASAEPRPELTAFRDCAELQQYLGTTDASSPEPQVGAGDTAGLPGPGMTEADKAATDGRVLVTIEHGAVRVFGASGRKLTRRGVLDFGDDGPDRLERVLLAGDRALVIASTYALPAEYRDRGENTTTLSLVDLADPDHPKLVESTRLDARYVTAFGTGTTLRVVTSYPTVPGQPLPIRQILGARGEPVSDAPMMSCTDVRHPADASGRSVLTVLTVDAAGPEALTKATATGLVTDGDLVHASDKRLYVATTPTAAGVPGAVHAFDAGTALTTAYRASGSVFGRVPNRAAMSERDGRLRVAVERGGAWTATPTAPETGIGIFEERDGRIAPVGASAGLAMSERLAAVCWLDEVVVLATGGNASAALHPVDLADPTAPQAMPALPAPNFRACLHTSRYRVIAVRQGHRTNGDAGTAVSSFDFDLDDPSPAVVGPDAFPKIAVMSGPLAYLPGPGLVVVPGLSGLDSVGMVLRTGSDGRSHKADRFDALGGLRQVLPVGDYFVALGDDGLQMLDGDLKVRGSSLFRPGGRR